jgi:hypothetical protein
MPKRGAYPDVSARCWQRALRIGSPQRSSALAFQIWKCGQSSERTPQGRARQRSRLTYSIQYCCKNCRCALRVARDGTAGPNSLSPGASVGGPYLVIRQEECAAANLIRTGTRVSVAILLLQPREHRNEPADSRTSLGQLGFLQDREDLLPLNRDLCISSPAEDLHSNLRSFRGPRQQAHIKAPPLPVAFSPHSEFIEYNEEVLLNGTGLDPSQFRSLTLLQDGVQVRVPVTAPATQRVDGVDIADIHDPANDRSVFQARYSDAGVQSRSQRVRSWQTGY